MAVSNVSNLDNLSKIIDGTSRTTTKSLDKDAFLQLLVAQLSNQDPMSPTSDTEFIAQLAQFSALEQMQSLTSTMVSSQAYSLVGKYVYVGMGNGSNDVLFGKVDGVINDAGISYLCIGDGKYPMSQVQGVADVSGYAMLSPEEKISQAAPLIGREITTTEKVLDEDGNVVKDEDGAEQTTTFTGVVDKIIYKDGYIYAQVGEKQIAIGDIEQIA